MEEALQNILDFVDKQTQKLAPGDLRDCLKALDEEIYTRYAVAETDLSMSGEA